MSDWKKRNDDWRDEDELEEEEECECPWVDSKGKAVSYTHLTLPTILLV